MSSTHLAKSGFTLIELIVVTTIGVLLLTGSVVAYNSFFRRQSSFSSAQEVISVLQQAQSRARSGDKPEEDCSAFEGFRVSASASQPSYVLQTLCDGEVVESVTYQLRSGEVFVNPFSVVFAPLPGSVAASDVTVRITQLGNSGNPPVPRYEFVVNQNGVIEGGTYVR